MDDSADDFVFLLADAKRFYHVGISVKPFAHDFVYACRRGAVRVNADGVLGFGNDGDFWKKARFIVTPKSSQKITVGFALRFQWRELLFSTVLLILSLVFQRGVLPVVLIVATGYASVGLLFLSNVRYTEAETERIDRETTEITLSKTRAFFEEKKETRKKSPLRES